jgi:hypothetical protein
VNTQFHTRRFRTRSTAARAALLCAVVGTGLYVAAAPSSATATTLGKVGGLKYVEADAPLAGAPNTTRTTTTATARCGRERTATAAGGSITGSAVASALSKLEPDSHAALGAGWHVLQPDATLQIFAVCAKKQTISPNVDIQTFPTAPSDLGLTSECAEGHVVGGGVYANTSTDATFINTTMPVDAGDAGAAPDDGWRAFQHLFNGTGVSMVVHAKCRKGPTPAYRTLSAPVPAHQPVTLTIHCNGGHVIGGGALISGPAGDAHIAASMPIDLQDADSVPDDGWRETVSNDSSNDLTTTVHAICVS